jgi:hypothetical protein
MEEARHTKYALDLLPTHFQRGYPLEATLAGLKVASSSALGSSFNLVLEALFVAMTRGGYGAMATPSLS